MQKLQKQLLGYIENGDKIEENYQNLISILNDQKIKEDRNDLKSFLYLLAIIGNNHYRTPQFFEKIEKIILYLKNEIKSNFQNSEIFFIFEGNKRILLFLIQEKILIIDLFIFNKITGEYKYIKKKYPQYFQPEIRPFITSQWVTKVKQDKMNISWVDEILKELPENFEENRKIGENETDICKLIQNDSIEEFITFVKKTEYSLKSKIELSIYETNPYIIKILKLTKTNQLFDFSKEDYVSLIEYAAFFGSVQIFNYLYKNGVELNPELWKFAIHSDNAEMINILDENKVSKIKFLEVYKESIKCHHNDMANYIQNNYLKKQDKISSAILKQCLKYHNFEFVDHKLVHNLPSMEYLCTYDYYYLFDNLLKTKNITNINKEII